MLKLCIQESRPPLTPLLICALCQNFCSRFDTILHYLWIPYMLWGWHHVVDSLYTYPYVYMFCTTFTPFLPPDDVNAPIVPSYFNVFSYHDHTHTSWIILSQCTIYQIMKSILSFHALLCAFMPLNLPRFIIISFIISAVSFHVWFTSMCHILLYREHSFRYTLYTLYHYYTSHDKHDLFSSFVYVQHYIAHSVLISAYTIYHTISICDKYHVISCV